MTHFLSTKQLSEYLGISIPTIQRWRVDGSGIRYMKRGGVVRYDMADVTAWVESNKRMFTGQAEVQHG